MILEIPLLRPNQEAFFSIVVDLDGDEYTLEFRWNVRGEFWDMSISTSSGELRHAGIVLVPSWELLRSTAGRTPAGFFILRDTSSPVLQAEDPGFEDLGTRHVLTYFTEDEI